MYDAAFSILVFLRVWIDFYNQDVASHKDSRRTDVIPPLSGLRSSPHADKQRKSQPTSHHTL